MYYEHSVLNRGFAEINPITYGAERCEPGHSVRSVRAFYLIHCVFSGKGVFEREGAAYPLEKNSLFLIRPGEATYYSADREDPWEYAWIGFEGRLCPELLESTVFAEGCCTALAPQALRVFDDIRRIPDLLPSTELLLCSSIYQLMAVLQKNSPAALSRPEEYAVRTADFIRANYTNPVSIEGIARILGIDRRYLCRIFSKKYGCSPKDYLVRVRLQKAAELLRQRGCPVREAARAAGYEDMYTFSKIFKKKYGLSPMQYKQHGQCSPQAAGAGTGGMTHDDK